MSVAESMTDVDSQSLDLSIEPCTPRHKLKVCSSEPYSQLYRTSNSSTTSTTFHGNTLFYTPSPPKVMRASNLQGKLVDPSRPLGFRPNYPSNSKLLRFRAGSSRPSSARSRLLLHSSSIKQDAADMDCS